jgi:hypothetical protein
MYTDVTIDFLFESVFTPAVGIVGIGGNIVAIKVSDRLRDWLNCLNQIHALNRVEYVLFGVKLIHGFYYMISCV